MPGLFESSVNSEGIETPTLFHGCNNEFESSVNSEGIETKIIRKPRKSGLRAV